jgi:hypothetical protein
MGEDDRCRAFWSWFSGEEATLRAGFLRGVDSKDYPALEQLVNRIGAELAKVTEGLAVRLNGGGERFVLAIQAPDPVQQPVATRLLELAPALPQWSFRDAIESPPKNVIVRDGDGRELVVAYADVRFVFLPPKPDGSISTIFTLDRDFDPKGDEQHLYLAVATELLKNAFGGTPPGMGSYALVPASWVGQESQPITELAEAWRDTAVRHGLGPTPA